MKKGGAKVGNTAKRGGIESRVLMEMAREIQYPHPKVLPMNTTQTTVDVKRFLKEKTRHEVVPALEQLVDELPDNLAGFSDAEKVVRGRFTRLQTN